MYPYHVLKFLPIHCILQYYVIQLEGWRLPLLSWYVWPGIQCRIDWKIL